MNDIQYLQTALDTSGILVVIGLVQYLIKPFIKDPKKYGAFSILFGIAYALFITWALTGLSSISLAVGIVKGLGIGLAGAGGYSTVQAWQGNVVVSPDKVIPTDTKVDTCPK